MYNQQPYRKNNADFRWGKLVLILLLLAIFTPFRTIPIIILIIVILALSNFRYKSPKPGNTSPYGPQYYYTQATISQSVDKNVYPTSSNYCFECGSKIETDYRYCNACGTRL